MNIRSLLTLLGILMVLVGGEVHAWEYIRNDAQERVARPVREGLLHVVKIQEGDTLSGICQGITNRGSFDTIKRCQNVIAFHYLEGPLPDALAELEILIPDTELLVPRYPDVVNRAAAIIAEAPPAPPPPPASEETELEALQATNQELSDALEAVQATEAKLRGDVAELQSQSDTFEQDLLVSQGVAEGLRAELAAAKSNIEKLNEELDLLAEFGGTSQEQDFPWWIWAVVILLSIFFVAALLAALYYWYTSQNLQKDIDAGKQLVEAARSNLEDEAKRNERMRQLEQWHENLTAENERLAGENQDARELVAPLQEKSQQLQNENTQLTARVEELEMSNRNLEADNHLLNAQVERDESELTTLREIKSTNEIELTRLRTRVEELGRLAGNLEFLDGEFYYLPDEDRMVAEKPPEGTSYIGCTLKKVHSDSWRKDPVLYFEIPWRRKNGQQIILRLSQFPTFLERNTSRSSRRSRGRRRVSRGSQELHRPSPVEALAS